MAPKKGIAAYGRRQTVPAAFELRCHHLGVDMCPPSRINVGMDATVRLYNSMGIPCSENEAVDLAIARTGWWLRCFGSMPRCCPVWTY
jgi:hypothetical protein